MITLQDSSELDAQYGYRLDGRVGRSRYAEKKTLFPAVILKCNLTLSRRGVFTNEHEVAHP